MRLRYPVYARRMPAGIVLAGGRSSRMGTPKAWLDWHGSTLLRRVCGIVARGAGGPVVVVPLQGILAGLQAVDSDVAFVAGFRQPLAAAYRPALAPLVAELVDADRLGPAQLFERCETRWVEDVPHPESVRNLNTRADYEAALAEPEPRVSVRGFGPLKRAAEVLRAATLGGAAGAIGVELDEHVLAALSGDQVARDPLEPLAEGDEVALMAADAAG
jgi:molybdenum cofactor guanylyltransferase